MGLECATHARTLGTSLANVAVAGVNAGGQEKHKGVAATRVCSELFNSINDQITYKSSKLLRSLPRGLANR